MEERTQKAVTTKITATSRAAIKLKDNFYTMEYSEERAVPEGLTDVEMHGERSLLFDDVNAVIDNQVEDLIKSFR